ncbi:hypothetical protein RHGRI_008677 [Rhododendron griersonianum]|uniref:Uncharacterized protein n=1 Tax=Rhododendron griersonianum TaxID=479676 RepID=A0AAV6L363_9ERIC|nr:hypothetical protein RHGRI_008677 [Rhododendron griersonianum]
MASPPRLLFLWAFLRKAKPETEPSSVDIVVSASPLCYSCSLGMKSYYSFGFLSLSVFKTAALPSSSFASAKLSPASASHQRSSLSEIMVVAGFCLSYGLAERFMNEKESVREKIINDEKNNKRESYHCSFLCLSQRPPSPPLRASQSAKPSLVRSQWWRSQFMWRVFFTSAIVAVVVPTAMGWCNSQWQLLVLLEVFLEPYSISLHVILPIGAEITYTRKETGSKLLKCSPCPEADLNFPIEYPRPPGMYGNYVNVCLGKCFLDELPRVCLHFLIFSCSAAAAAFATYRNHAH